MRCRNLWATQRWEDRSVWYIGQKIQIIFNGGARNNVSPPNSEPIRTKNELSRFAGIWPLPIRCRIQTLNRERFGT
jgi:hypothetical protein